MGKINLNKEYFFLNPYPYRQAWTHVFSKLIDQPLKGLNFEQHGLVVRELAAQRSELSTTTDIERRLWKTTVFALEHRTERALIEAALMSRKMSANIPLLNKKSVKAIAENE